MDSSWLTAFVDECGTNELDSNKQGVSHLFICVAIVVNYEAIRIIEIEMRSISSELCGGAEVRSSKIGSNHHRRLQFINRIKNLPFGYYALVINKNRIKKESGLKYKTSFYKYINQMLYRRLDSCGMNMRVVADEIGGRDFMESFESYIIRKSQETLFTNFTSEHFVHEFAGSKETPLIQLADLLAGTLSYCFDEGKKSEFSEVYRELLRSKEIEIQSWPVEIVPIPDKIPDTVRGLNDRLRKTCSNRAAKFIQENENSDIIEKAMQAATLRYLFFARNFEKREHQAVYADILMEDLKEEGFEEISKQAFSLGIIGKLREAGIIIAGTNEGYRLALSVEDIQDYLNHDKNIIEPMINRLITARDVVRHDTANGYDILDNQQYTCLKEIVEAFSDYRINCSVIGNRNLS